jgi:DmsE family decaheme c-type cytochrome
MHSFCKALVHGGFVAALVAAALATAGSASAGTPRQEAVKAPAVQAPHGQYAGAETCLSCHADKAASLKQGAHSRQFRAGSPVAASGCQTCHGDTKANLGCESCHGPGKAHADAGGDKTKIRVISNMSPTESSEICASCHFRSTHALWAGSQHDQRKVGCVTCHSVHEAKGTTLLKASNEAGLCVTCHRTVVNKQRKFNHMPVREGSLTCSSCHNVHGTSNVKLLRTGGTVTESCVSCHTEKRGPFLWEHAPVAEDCVTCHEPHGSNNDRLLVAKLPFLCQRCHVTSRHPPTVYDGYLLTTSTNSNKIYGRSCVFCHQQVHGSNAPSGKAFLR